MKLILCPSCKNLVELRLNKTSRCECGACAGKYLEDKVTAVVTNNTIVVGIDNNSYRQAYGNAYSETAQGWDQRVDFYFTGWVPNFPGEVIKVKSPRAVSRYKLKEGEKNTTSTRPTTGSD